MPCKRNEEAVRTIKDAARDIMMTEGYDAMTYSELAKRTGLPRATAQYYFPKKELLAMGLMQAIANLASPLARRELGEHAHLVSIVYATAQIVVGLYYGTPGMRQFMLDISSSRKLQHAVSPDWSVWLREMAGMPNLSLTQEQQDDLAMVHGSVHEMHYVYLSEGRTPSFAKLTREATLTQAKVLGIKTREANKLLDAGTLSQERTQEIAKDLLRDLSKIELPTTEKDA